jgi:hypothetical protein
LFECSAGAGDVVFVDERIPVVVCWVGAEADTFSIMDFFWQEFPISGAPSNEAYLVLHEPLFQFFVTTISQVVILEMQVALSI